MIVKNNRGKTVCCRECLMNAIVTDNLEGYKSYTPPFATAMDSDYYGWCKLHEKEVMAMFDKAVSINQNSLMRSSDS